MAIRTPNYDKYEHARRGLQIYDGQVSPQVASNPGKIVAIDVDTGAFKVADNTLGACEQLLAHHPDAQIWCARIGPIAVHRFGPRVRSVTR